MQVPLSTCSQLCDSWGQLRGSLVRLGRTQHWPFSVQITVSCKMWRHSCGLVCLFACGFFSGAYSNSMNVYFFSARMEKIPKLVWVDAAAEEFVGWFYSYNQFKSPSSFLRACSALPAGCTQTQQILCVTGCAELCVFFFTEEVISVKTLPSLLRVIAWNL